MYRDRTMFGIVKSAFQMLDNSGPIARTAPAPYQIVDCEKRSVAGLTCNSVIQSNMEPAGNNNCAIVPSSDAGYSLVPSCQARPLDTAAVSA
mmetsp:Transcript_18475/g.60653  ORF Transcript_18475/g.60653 Transcript_18475/m.60653 type:complete len:92 (-) Transcript_18475:171-446(-)